MQQVLFHLIRNSTLLLLDMLFHIVLVLVMNEPDGQFVTISIDLAGEWVNPDGKINSSWPSWNGYFKLDRRFLSDRERAVTAARIVPYLGVDQLEKSDNW